MFWRKIPRNARLQNWCEDPNQSLVVAMGSFQSANAGVLIISSIPTWWFLVFCWFCVRRLVLVLLVRWVLVAFSCLNHLSAGVPGAWRSKVGFHGCGGHSPIIKIIYCTSLCVYIFNSYMRTSHVIISLHNLCILHMDTTSICIWSSSTWSWTLLVCELHFVQAAHLKITTYLLFWTDSVCQSISWYDNSGYWGS